MRSRSSKWLERLEEDEAAEELEVVRQVQVGVLAGHDQVGLGDDPDAAPAGVDDRARRGSSFSRMTRSTCSTVSSGLTVGASGP